MDKSWMNKSRKRDEYKVGVERFLDFAFNNTTIEGMILCPCIDCKNGVCVGKNEARNHLIVRGFIKGYTNWIAHGEFLSSIQTNSTLNYDRPNTSNDRDDMRGLIYDAFGVSQQDVHLHNLAESPRDEEIASGVCEKFYKLIDESQKRLYEGCEGFSKLSFIIRLLHIKCLGKWSNKYFDMLLKLLGEAFPEAMTDLPKSYYEAEKLMKELGLGYEKIDACPNDCTLYWGVNRERILCEMCKESRWRTSEKDPTGEKRKIAHKVLWYFPIKPRLQRLFMSSKTACHMRWHSEGRTKDGYMRHPADSPAWQTFDHKYPEFANEPRNVRLGLASDGFNPFSNMNVSHSTWPVILTPYNLPPWMCMKSPYSLLSLLIPGPTAPGNNIDIYLQPLIADLKDLWDVGVETYDASTKQNFQLHASLMWTISDFPGYANLSGWSTKGELACPVCHRFTHSRRLKNGGKYCYMGHRRFLDKQHKFRKNAQLFDGTEEYGRPPPRLSGDMVIEELKDIEFKFGKKVDDNPKLPSNWKKKSIFFELPYWKDNVIRHNLDFMHIEKNVCESICGTLLNMDGKSKDNHKSRLDLKEMGIRPELHPVTNESGRVYLPAAAFSMSKQEKSMFCNVLKNIKVPDGYASNISRCVQVKPPKLVGLKSHDFHILMEQLLPVALRKALPKSVRQTLIKLSRYFRELCSKVISPADVVRLEKEIAIILCELEIVFPPSFFDVMVHLTAHLATEVKLAGPVHYRWMYPIERYLGTLKSYVRNKSRPEGSIAQGYVAEECLTFCSLYLADYVESKFNRTTRNEGITVSTTLGLDIFRMEGHSLGKGTAKKFDADTIRRAHQYILFNCEMVKPYIEQHHAMVEKNHPGVAPHQIERVHSETFAKWFMNHVECLQLPKEDPISKDLKLLARGPEIIGLTYEKFVVNGFRFHTRELERKRKTQNSGVTVKAMTSSYSSISDENPILSELVYYGVLTNIIELDYGGRRVVLFECDWVSKGKRLKQDIDGFTLANFTNVKRHNEPFILASQAVQVFYVADPIDSDWHVIISTAARGDYNMQPMADVETYLQSNICNPTVSNESEDIRWVREGVEGAEIFIS